MSSVNKKDWKSVSEPPVRQGFYEVELTDGHTLVAEWREQQKKAGKQWWQYVTEDPTVEKTPVLLEGVVAYRPATKEAVDALLKRELTRDEQIQAAYENHCQFRSLYEPHRFPVPENRRLAVGDELWYGNLKDVKAVAFFEEGEVVVFEYQHIESNYGRPLDLGRKLRAANWLDVLPKRTTGDTNLARDSLMYGGYCNSDISSILHQVFRCGMDDSPDYQRGYVWSEADQQMYLESVFAGRELGRFLFLNRKYPHRDQIFDGKQRLHTLVQFVSSKIAYRGVYWHELSQADRRKFESRSVQWAELPAERYSRADLLNIFLEVNAAGVPQTEEHLAHVRALLEEELKKPQRPMDE